MYADSVLSAADPKEDLLWDDRLREESDHLFTLMCQLPLALIRVELALLNLVELMTNEPEA